MKALGSAKWSYPCYSLHREVLCEYHRLGNCSVSILQHYGNVSNMTRCMRANSWYNAGLYFIYIRFLLFWSYVYRSLNRALPTSTRAYTFVFKLLYVVSANVFWTLVGDEKPSDSAHTFKRIFHIVTCLRTLSTWFQRVLGERICSMEIPQLLDQNHISCFWMCHPASPNILSV